jgi:S-adenosyl methyltransferase
MTGGQPGRPLVTIRSLGVECNPARASEELNKWMAARSGERLSALIDFHQPVAILLLSVLHFVADEADPAGLTARLHGGFPSGSHVAISHATPDAVAEVADAAKVFDKATTPAHVRTGPEIAKLVIGLDMVEPGLAWTPQWRPEPGATLPPDVGESYYRAVVARKP